MREREESSNAQTQTASNRDDPAAPPPADGSVEAIADYLIGLIDQIEGLVPNFQPYDANDVRRVAAAARFAKELVPQIIASVTAYDPAAEVKIFDVEGAREALRFGTAMTRFAQRLSALLDGVQFTIDSELAKAGTQALATYAWAKQHAKSPDGVGLRPYVGGMSRAIKKTMNRREPVAPKSEPVVGKTGDDDVTEEARKAIDEAEE